MADLAGRSEVALRLIDRAPNGYPSLGAATIWPDVAEG